MQATGALVLMEHSKLKQVEQKRITVAVVILVIISVAQAAQLTLTLVLTEQSLL